MTNDRTTPEPAPIDRHDAAAIDVAHLVKVYKSTRAVDDISFSIARGSITGLLGGNGAGKTTTIAMIMGLVLPTSGRIAVLGHPMPSGSAQVLGRMNFESPYVDMPARLTVRQNLTIFGRLYSVAHLKARIEKLAADLDLGDFIDRPNGKLSAGQKTRVALAKALINQPELLLLDEPTASLDLAYQLEIRSILLELNRTRGLTIVISTHDLNLAAGLCRDLILLDRGRVLASGPVESILEPTLIRRLYDVEVDITTHPRTGHLTVVPVSRASRATPHGGP